jgi:hypothetical protein
MEERIRLTIEDILKRASEDLKYDISKIESINNDINIALFMGYEIASDFFQMEWIGTKDEKRFERLKKKQFNYVPLLHSEHSEPLFIESFGYSKNWYDLMKVVEKIESLNYMTEIISISQISHKMSIKSGGLVILESRLLETKKEAIYKTCVDFIIDYNQRNL